MYPWLLMVLAGESEFTSVGKAFLWTVLLEQNLKLIADWITVESRLHPIAWQQQAVCGQLLRISTVCYAEGVWRMRRHGPVIAHFTDSEDCPIHWSTTYCKRTIIANYVAVQLVVFGWLFVRPISKDLVTLKPSSGHVKSITWFKLNCDLFDCHWSMNVLMQLFI